MAVFGRLNGPQTARRSKEGGKASFCRKGIAGKAPAVVAVGSILASEQLLRPDDWGLEVSRLRKWLETGGELYQGGHIQLFSKVYTEKRHGHHDAVDV